MPDYGQAQTSAPVPRDEQALRAHDMLTELISTRLTPINRRDELSKEIGDLDKRLMDITAPRLGMLQPGSIHAIPR